MPSAVPVALTIAGFDPSSGAGITADLAVFAAHHLYGTSAITVLTAQSTLGVAGTMPVDVRFLEQTLDVLWADLPPAGVKIGALGTAELAAAVGRRLKTLVEGSAGKSQIPVVFDPVLLSTSGAELYPAKGMAVLHEALLPQVGWMTPNWNELALLAGARVTSVLEAERAADALGARHPGLNMIVTGGDQAVPIDLLRTADGSFFHLDGERLASRSTHGTGCAHSSALLANLIAGRSPLMAATAAKQYVVEAMRRAPEVGGGRGPLGLLWPLEG